MGSFHAASHIIVRIRLMYDPNINSRVTIVLLSEISSLRTVKIQSLEALMQACSVLKLPQPQCSAGKEPVFRIVALAQPGQFPSLCTSPVCL